MLYIPPINIYINPEKDGEKFWKFLNHPQFPQLRNANLSAHPRLREALEKEDSQEVVMGYVKSFYTEHLQEIELIYKRSKDTVDHDSTEALKELSRLMEYTWEEGIKYEAYLSILTSSTFDNKTFTYSILGELWGKNPIKKSVLSVGIHEISHLIFLERLESIERDNSITLHQDGKYFLKESLTTALLNTEKLKGILGTEEDLGNPEIQQLYIIASAGQAVLFKEYIKQQILKGKSNSTPFDCLLKNLVLTVHAAEGSFKGKRELWNKNGPALFKDQNLLTEYQEPILF